MKNHNHVSKAKNSGSPDSDLPSAAESKDTEVLLNELHVYKIELDMQNEELISSYTALDNERAKFVGLFDLAPIGYFILDHLGGIEDVNLNGIELLGSTKKEIIAKRFQSFIAEQSWESFYSFLHRMQQAERKQSIELSLLLSDQRTAYTRIEGRAIRSENPKEVKYYIAIIDMTAGRNEQQMLKETTRRLEMTLKASSTGTWSIEPGADTIFLDVHSIDIIEISKWNFTSALREVLGYIHPGDKFRFYRMLVNVINGSKDIDIDFKIINPEKKIKYLTVKGNEVQGLDEEKYFAGILIDITERKLMTMESEYLRNSQQKLIFSAALAAQENERNEISQALHDSVCQLLYGIRLNLDYVQRTKDMKGEFKHVNALIEQAITETRKISYELTPTVFRDFGFVEGIKEMARQISTPIFVIETFIHDAVNSLSEDVQLYAFRIIQELINNAIKHSRASRAEVRVSYDNGEVEIVVADNGKGFKKKQELLFKMGSGLSGIRNRVFLLNGDIEFNSSKIGLVVTIRFRNQ